MHARNLKTGKPIVATVERIYGHAGIAENSFQREADGSINVEHDDGTKMFWDTTVTETENGEKLYVDDDGNIVRESGIELVANADGDNPARAEDERPRPQG